MDLGNLDGIVKRLRSDKVGVVDPVRMQQNASRAADLILSMKTEIEDLNVSWLRQDAARKAMQADLDAANARIATLTSTSSVKRSK